MIPLSLPVAVRSLTAVRRPGRPVRRRRVGALGAALGLLAVVTLAPAPARAERSESEDGAAAPPAILLVEAVDETGDVLGGLEPGNLRVLRGEEPLTVTTSQETGPDGVVIYFDLPLLSTEQVLASASTLSDRAATLVRVGEVQVVVGDTGSRTALPPSIDPEIVSQALAGVGTRYGGRDALVEVRTRFLEGSGPWPVRPPAPAPPGRRCRPTGSTASSGWPPDRCSRKRTCSAGSASAWSPGRRRRGRSVPGGRRP